MSRYSYKTVTDVVILSVILTFLGTACWVRGAVSFLPSSTSVTVGTNWHFSTEVRIQAANGNPGAFQVMIIYDPNVVRIIQITPSTTSVFAGNIFYDNGSFDSGYTRIVATQTSHTSDILDESVFSIEWVAVGKSGQASDIVWQVESLIDYWWRPMSYANGLSSVGINTADINNNGIPDWWEIQMTGSTTNLKAGGDFDGDGVSDLDEFIAGTDPSDSSSFPGLHIKRDGTNVVVFCTGRSDRFYSFEFNTLQTGSSWSNWISVLPSANGTIYLTDSPNRTTCIYRCKVQLPEFGDYLQSRTNAYWTDAALTDFTSYGAAISPLRPSNLYTLTALDQVSNGVYCFAFNLANGDDTSAGRWAGVRIASFQPSFNGTTHDIVFGLSATGTTRVKFEAEDVSGAKATVWLSDISAIERRYRISQSVLTNAGGAGFAVTAIKSFSIVADDTVVGWNKANGNVTLHLVGVTNDMPVLIQALPYDPTVLSSFGTYSPTLTAGGGNTDINRAGGIIFLTQMPQDNMFNYEYNVLDNDTCFTFASISRGGSLLFRLPNSFYTFAAQGDSGTRVKVELRDSSQRQITVLVDLSPVFHNYKIDFTAPYAPVGFNRLTLSEINFVQDWTTGTPQLSGSVQIKTLGLDFY